LSLRTQERTGRPLGGEAFLATRNDDDVARGKTAAFYSYKIQETVSLPNSGICFELGFKGTLSKMG